MSNHLDKNDWGRAQEESQRQQRISNKRKERGVDKIETKYLYRDSYYDTLPESQLAEKEHIALMAPPEGYRITEPKDFVVAAKIYYWEYSEDPIDEVGALVMEHHVVADVINPESKYKAFTADYGGRHGLYGTFVKQ